MLGGILQVWQGDGTVATSAVCETEVNMSGARGRVEITTEECKGCGLCVAACPPKCLMLATELSAYGAHPARYIGDSCTACGICYYCCPEPGAVTVFRRLPN